MKEKKTIKELIDAIYSHDVQFTLESRLPMSSTKDRPRWYAQAEWWEKDGIKWIMGTKITLDSNDQTIEEALEKLLAQLEPSPTTSGTTKQELAHYWQTF